MVHCKHCLHEFTACACQIGDHYMHSTPAYGVSQCQQVLANMLALMQ